MELARNHADETHAGQHYAIWMEEKGLPDWKKHFQNDWCDFDFNDAGERTQAQEHRWTLPEEYHYNAWIAERSNALMEAYVKEDKPFFLWSSFFDPHPPYLIPEPWDTMYDPENLSIPCMTPGEHDKNPPHFQKTQQANPDFSYLQEPGGNTCHGCESHLHDAKELAKDIAVYYGMISCMDKYIGKILDKLDALGVADNTAIVFSTDHGHFYGHHGLTAKGPFQYEDGIRIPYIVSWPGQVPEGQESSALQSLVDLAPSFLALADVEKPIAMTGVDQTNVWRGEQESARESVMVEFRHQPTTIHLKTYVEERYKITMYYKQSYGELFDLQEDPGEVNNLWDAPEYQSLKTELLIKLLHEDLGNESIPMPRIAGA